MHNSLLYSLCVKDTIIANVEFLSRGLAAWRYSLYMYINYIFADDCIIYRIIKSEQDHLQLQQDLYTVYNMNGHKNDKMRFNISKCVTLM